MQHLWQSKLFVIFKGLARWRIGLCSEMQLARQWLQMHFVMHVCWKKNCYAGESFGSKKNANFAPCFGPQNGGWKMNPKMVPEFDPQNGVQKWHPKNGVQKWHPKGGPISWSRRNQNFIYIWTPFLGAIFAPHFGVPFLDPILGVKFWHHFWVHFSTPILGSRTWCKICNFFAAKAFTCIAIFSNKHASQNASVVIGLASCISAHNPILHLAKPLKNRKVLIATNVAHEQDGLKPQNLILWRSLNAAPVFHMKNDPVLGGRQSWYFWNKNLHPASIDNGDVSTYQLPGPDNVEALAEYVRSIWAHWQEILITPTDFKNGGGCHAKHRISATC